MSVIDNINMLLMLLSYVASRVGKFTPEDKVHLLEFISYVAQNPEANSKDLLTTYMRRLT
jgi:hypothetical protein